MEQQNNNLQPEMSDKKSDMQQDDTIKIQQNNNSQSDVIAEKSVMQMDDTTKTPKKNIIKSKIGGQALIEGIMMRGLDKSSMAVRRPDGSINLEVWGYDSQKYSKWYRKTPFIRGSVNMVESLILGYKCLMKSADISMEELQEETAKPANSSVSEEKADLQSGTEQADSEKNHKDESEQAGDSQESVANDKAVQIEEIVPQVKKEEGVKIQNQQEKEKQPDKKQNDKEQGGFGGALTIVGMVLGVGLALLLFMFLPMLIVNGISNFITLGFWKTAVEGVIKITVLILYMAAMSLLKDTRRTFEYHGAEHKSIACYEAGEALTVENIKKFKRFHPRCGTSFILIVLIISIVVTSIVTWNTLWLRLVIKLALLPVIVGISYEIIRLAGRYDNPVTRVVSAPGLALQRLTTKEPDASQIEVAIKALNAVIPEDREADQW